MVRARVEGLRDSDPQTLGVLVQDLVRLPLGKLDIRSVCDLVALSELDDLPRPLRRELVRFREQVFREIADLPDGVVLHEFLDGLAEVEPWRVPAALRELLGGMDRDALGATSRARLEAMGQAWAAQPPRPPQPTRGRRMAIDRSLPERSARSPAARPARTRVPADPSRAAWIREDVLERLSHYPGEGLKESLLVAGARHRAPFSDLGEAEVLAEIRRLEREGRVARSRGRVRLRGRR